MSLLNDYLKNISQEEGKDISMGPLPSMLRGPKKEYSGGRKYLVIILVLIPSVLIGMVVWQHNVFKFRKVLSSIEENQKIDNPTRKTVQQNDQPTGYLELKVSNNETLLSPVSVERITASGTVDGVVPGEEQTLPVPIVVGKRMERRQILHREPSLYKVPSLPKGAFVRNTTASMTSRENAQNFYQLGLVALQEGNVVAAEHYFHDMLEILPADIDGLLNISTVYIRQNRLDKADEVLKRIRELDTANYKSLDNLGVIAIRQNKKKAAKKYFNRALSLNPLDEVALSNLAYLAQIDNNQAEAAQFYDKLISINPENIEVLISYAHLMSQGKSINRAIQLYTQCLKLESVQNDRGLAKKIGQRIQLIRSYN